MIKLEATNKTKTYSATDFGSFREHFGFVLPPSFMEMMTEYGYGRYLGLIIFYVPDQSSGDSLYNQSPRVMGFIRSAISEDYLELEPDGTMDLANNFFPFGMSENGEYFVWNIDDEARTGQREEYEIFVIGARMGSIRRAGVHVGELLSDLCGDRVKQILGSGYEPLPAVFQGIDLVGSSSANDRK